MSTYTLKSVVQRGSMLGAVLAIVVATVIPASSVFADSLNPLTERSLMLSSSAPGYTDTDGSGNSEGAPNANGGNFAPAGSGPNGKKSGETFTFKMSTDTSPTGTDKPIKAFTLQYCTDAAGKCQAPGDNDKATPGLDGDFRDGVFADPGNLTGRPDNATAHPLGKSDLDVVGTWTEGAAAGQFQVLVEGAPSTGWAMATINAEDNTHSGFLTGKKNLIRLTHTGVNPEDGAIPQNGDKVQIIFKASSANYITNPGSGSFFVKINTYDTNTVGDLIPGTPAATNTHIIDGGVTVANVMTDSIHITTKVLETMSFSVGTRNRDTVVVDCTPASVTTGCEGSGSLHGTCSPIQNINNNRLNLGDPDAEYSLETGKAWDVNSYWRLSSNSSGGATVYYSGNTLANTVGDEIANMATEGVSTPGTEQFGLGFVDANLDPVSADFQDEIDDIANNGRFHEPTSFPFRTVSTQTTGVFDISTLPAQPMSTDYDQATGTLDDGAGHPGTAQFKFKKSSLMIPEPIAQQNDQVISCATAKMRYVANIGADTPAGVYTTKINYLAAPQY